MDQTFSTLLAQWTSFYTTAATGAATFSGLLFVGLSINLDVISREEKRVLRVAAKMTFDLFLTVFFVALLLLLPNLSPLAAGWIVAGSGLLALSVPGYEVYLRMRGRNSGHWMPQLLLPALTPIILELILIRQGFAIGAQDQTALAFLPVVLGVMLLAGVTLSWRLLIDVARFKPKLEAQDRNAERDRGTERQIRNLVRELRTQNRRLREAENAPPPPPRERERAARK